VFYKGRLNLNHAVFTGESPASGDAGQRREGMVQRQETQDSSQPQDSRKMVQRLETQDNGVNRRRTTESGDAG
jgi:hypothetical protein